MLLALVAAALSLGFLYTYLTADLPAVSQIQDLLDPHDGPLMEPTRIYDRTGHTLLLSLENPGIPRRYLYLDPNKSPHFSPELARTAVGLLEPDFWTSPGFLLNSLVADQPATIAERLVQDLLLWQEPPGLRRSLRMRLLAAQLVNVYGRAQVLEWYLNSANFGHLSYGSDSAARLYLDKSAAQVNLAESALLIAVHQAPGLNPLDAPEAALERQAAALQTLLEQSVISEGEYLRAVDTRLDLTARAPESVSAAEAFSRLAVEQLSARFGRERVERGGLRVITTLDYSLQLELSCLVRAQLTRLTGQASYAGPKLPDGSPCQSARLLPTLPESDLNWPNNLSASAVVMDPATGQVLALLGDTTRLGEGNRLIAHEPGSLLTPMVALASFARGYSPASLTWDIPNSQFADLEAIANPGGVYHGPVRLRMALANDYLVPQAGLLEQIGAENVWRLASALGISSIAEEHGAGLLYEGGRVSPLEIAQAYSIFASMGVRAGQEAAPGGGLAPVTTLYVEDLDGEPLLQAFESTQQAVISEPLAYLVHHVLSDTSARWPSLGYPNALEIGRPAGAKIGQVSGGEQIWAVGYTPQRTAVFWLGLDETAEDERQLNPRLAAGMWHAMMQYMHQSLPVEDWSEPPGVTHVNVCDPSGALPTSACPNVVSEVFLTGREPVAYDSLFRVFEINSETGRLATVFTPPVLVEEKTYMMVPLEARAWALEAGLSLPPEDYDAIQPSASSEYVQITSPDSFDYVSGKVTLMGTAAGEGFRFYQLQAGQGLNPQTWLAVASDGTAPVEDGVLGVWDTQGLDGLYALRLMVARQDQQVETAVIQVTVDNNLPLVRIPYPVNGQSFAYPEARQITFQAEASDSVGVSRLEWYVNGRKVGESLQAPYAFTWRAEPGEHTLTVKAYDFAGNVGESEEVQFWVE